MATENDDLIVIKKYENRRLYNTEASQYINLDGVAKLVREGKAIQVVEARGGKDVTRHVLTQIIVDGAKDSNSGPPVDFLRDMIRVSDRAHRDFLQWYLKGASEVYDRMRDAWEVNPIRPPGREQLHKIMKLWDPMRIAEQLQTFSTPKGPEASGEPASGKKRRSSKKARPSAPPRDELEELKERLADLENRLKV